jgi:predicted nuclease of predicted toxin-antitoxin system
MRFLADENFPGPVIRHWREQGHDVFSVKEQMKGATDREVLERANAEGRVVVTFDKDFGELAFNVLEPATCGVILFRLDGETPQADNARAIGAVASRSDWAGQFSVITSHRTRIRPLPGET